MKCSNCGGELVFQDNIGVCSSCNSKHKIESAFENTEVCICYVENDANGRRTKDSVIAAEVYKKLESKKISTFYERISAGSAVSGDLEILRRSAIFNAKIVVIVGTNTENFETICNKYADELSDKKTIPVISDMKPEQLPKELRRFQASNFDSIGALNDLSVSILNILGRGKEVELEEIYNKKIKKKKILTIISAALIALIVCVVAVFACVFLFDKEEEVVLTDNDIYNSAVKLLEEDKYLDSAAQFNKIPDYKDSSNQVKKIFDRYDGYYQDAEGTHTLYLNIIDGKTAEFVFEKVIEKKIVKIEESLIINDNKVTGKYVDNVGNEGNIDIDLFNDRLSVTVSTSVENNKISMGNTSVECLLKDKLDRPPMKTVTKDTVMSFMTTLTTVDDIRALGYELEYIDTTGPYDMDFGTHYYIANTDIRIVTTPYDLRKYNGVQEVEDLPTHDEDVVVAVIAPVSLICPEKIGQSTRAYTKNDVVFVPDATSFSRGYYDENTKNYTMVFSFGGGSGQSGLLTMDNTTIGKDSTVGIASKKIAGDYIYKIVLNHSREVYDTVS